MSIFSKKIVEKVCEHNFQPFKTKKHCLRIKHPDDMPYKFAKIYEMTDEVISVYCTKCLMTKEI